MNSNNYNLNNNIMCNINCIIKKINIQDIIHNQDFDFECILENYLLIYSEYCNNVFLIKNNEFGKNDCKDYHLIEIIYPLNDYECKEIQIINNKLFTLSNYKNNNNIFLIWNLSILDKIVEQDDLYINNRIDTKIPLIKKINVDIGIILGFNIFKNCDYILCMTLNNNIHKININNGTTELIYVLDNWIYYYLPMLFFNNSEIVVFDKCLKLIKIDTHANKKNYNDFNVDNSNGDLKNCINSNNLILKSQELNNRDLSKTYNNVNDFSKDNGCKTINEYIKKIQHVGKYIFILRFSNILEQYCKYSFKLLNRYNLSKEYKFYLFNKNLQSFKFNELKVTKINNIVVSTNNTIEMLNNNSHIMIFNNTNIQRIVNKDVNLNKHTINYYPIDTKKYLISLLCCINRKYNNCKDTYSIPLEIIEIIFKQRVFKLKYHL